MKVFVFDLLAYGDNLEHVKVGPEMTYPLSREFFKADVGPAPATGRWPRLVEIILDGLRAPGSGRLPRPI